jgi:hypothetical protein
MGDQAHPADGTAGRDRRKAAMTRSSSFVRLRSLSGSVAALALAALVGGVLAAPAAADDPPAPAAPAPPTDEMLLKVSGLEAQVQAHLDEKSADGMRQDLQEISKLLRNVTDPKLRARVTSLVPKILSAARDDLVAKAALKTLGETGDSALAKHLRPFLAQPKPKEVPPLLLDAIDAAAKLKADETVPPLLVIVEKSKRLDAAVAAMKALAHFGESKRMREKIVSTLVETTRKSVPGVAYRDGSIPGVPPGTVRTGDEAASRWDALSGQLAQTLNQLTGQNVASAQDWFDLYDRYKNSLGQIFTQK